MQFSNNNFNNLINEFLNIAKTEKYKKLIAEKKIALFINSLLIDRNPNTLKYINEIHKLDIKDKLFSSDFKIFLMQASIKVNHNNFVIMPLLFNNKDKLFNGKFQDEMALAKELNDLLKQPLDNLLTDNIMGKIISLNQNITNGMKKSLKSFEQNFINILKDAKSEFFSKDNPLNFVLAFSSNENNPIQKYNQENKKNLLLNSQKEINQKEPKLKGDNLNG